MIPPKAPLWLAKGTLIIVLMAVVRGWGTYQLLMLIEEISEKQIAVRRCCFIKTSNTEGKDCDGGAMRKNQNHVSG